VSTHSQTLIDLFVFGMQILGACFFAGVFYWAFHQNTDDAATDDGGGNVKRQYHPQPPHPRGGGGLALNNETFNARLRSRGHCIHNVFHPLSRDHEVQSQRERVH
jgi:hypothetical protein